MTKKIKISTLVISTIILFIYWAVLAVTHTKLHMVNYWWQAALAVLMFTGGVFGLMTARHWQWLKSGVGRSVVFISLGLVIWGIAQAGWAYFVIKNPSQQSPTSAFLEYLYISSIPLWFIGMLMLSKATGARYGLRGVWAKLGVIGLIIIMFAISYYLLVIVARGGTHYFQHNSFIAIFWDLGYAAGDAINLTLALAIFGLSWNYLGGIFKKPILTILAGFFLIYLADLFYSYYYGKGQYYNGQWSDVLYLLMVAVFGIGVCLLDPEGTVDPKLKQPPIVPAHPQSNPLSLDRHSQHSEKEKVA